MNIYNARPHSAGELSITSPLKGSFQQIPLIKSEPALPLIHSTEPQKHIYSPQAPPLYYPANYNYNYATPTYQHPHYSHNQLYYYPANYINSPQPVNYVYPQYQQYYPKPAVHNMYGNIVGYNQPRPAERRVTYHPYQQSYIDYEERVVLVPVEKVQTKYIENIHITEYVPQVREQIVLETVPVERNYTKVQYVPVQRKIIHLPKDQKLYNETHQHGRNIRVHTQHKKDHSTPSTVNTSLDLGSLTKRSAGEPTQRQRVQAFRESPVKRMYEQHDQLNPEIRILKAM